jgi:hypothetical protein
LVNWTVVARRSVWGGTAVIWPSVLPRNPLETLDLLAAGTPLLKHLVMPGHSEIWQPARRIVVRGEVTADVLGGCDNRLRRMAAWP